ncbi:MAG: radical SAM protein [Saprospiraceae bacterium]|nr:radical SAM protein [Saprospiraceae bacterium]
MINEDIYDISSGIRSDSERVAYLYSEVEKKHNRRFLFEPFRVLGQPDFLSRYSNGENPFPKSIEIDPTNFCNHDCPFCIYSSLHKPGHKERMKEDKLFEVISEAHTLGVESILFIGGGEPLGHSKTVDAIEYANGLGISVGLVTNGALMRTRDVGIIKKNATYVRFSIDSGTADTHKVMHQSNDFNRVISNLKLVASKPRKSTIGVSYFISEVNFHELSLAASLAKSAGADYIQFKTYAGIGISDNWYSLLLKEIEKVITFSGDSFDVHVMENVFNRGAFQSRDYSKCHWQGFKTIIGADGNMYLCTQKRGKADAVIGNIYENTLKEIWGSEQRERVVNSIILEKCPFCVHNTQNKLIEFLGVSGNTHTNFY